MTYLGKPRGHVFVIKSVPPSAAYLRQWAGSALVQIMACRLYGTKPLSEPMTQYCSLDPSEQYSVKYQSEYKTFYSQKYIWKCRLGNVGHFVSASMC